MFLFQRTFKSLSFLNQVKRAFSITNYSIKPVKYELKVNEQPGKMPILVRKSDEILIKQWWSQSPFEKTQPLRVPVLKFLAENGQAYTGKTVDLDHDIFNVPLRRDIVHSYVLWRQNRDEIKTHITKTKGTVSGSGKKPYAQKGTGKARMGNKRAPGRKKGGKAHGPKPRILRYPLNKKIRLQALKVVLSAKLAEGKLRIIETESVDEPKTRAIAKMLEKMDKRSRILIVHPYQLDSNFELAHQNIQKLQSCYPNELSVLKVLTNDRVFITLEALRQLTQELQDRTFRNYRMKHVERGITESEAEREQVWPSPKKQDTQVTYDPSKPPQFKFKILQDYYEQYEKLKENGEIQKYRENIQ
ncbi:hypothetical protein ABPG74_001082 [Tetrahymena malaccensis]